jgi:hypothetical protein
MLLEKPTSSAVGCWGTSAALQHAFQHQANRVMGPIGAHI